MPEEVQGKAGASYLRLDASRLIETIVKLHERVRATVGSERGLARVCTQLLHVARHAEDRVERLDRPNLWLRLLPVLLTVVVVYLSWMMAVSVNTFEAQLDKVMTKEMQEHMRQLLSWAALPIALSVPLPFLIAAFVSVWTVEARWKRHAALKDLHELRSIIHVIDMHQLTKDPHSPPAPDDPDPIVGERLIVYLDSCSDMISLAGKIAALYAESSHDPVVIAAVSDLGQITSNLSSKIWQKLNMVDRRSMPAR